MPDCSQSQLFASGLRQVGDEGEGILGFLPSHIRKEVRRGVRLVSASVMVVGCTGDNLSKPRESPTLVPIMLEELTSTNRF